MRIQPSISNPSVIYFTNSAGRQLTKTLWVQDETARRAIYPLDRILTITLWTQNGYRWIITPDKILVIQLMNGDERLEASVPITSAVVEEIQATIRSLPVASLGKNYNADDVDDGASLAITFTATGEEGPNNVTMSNIWREEFRTLLAVVSKYSPGKGPLIFEGLTFFDERSRRQPATIRTRAEADAIFWPKPRAPWWCVWRFFLN